MLPGPAVIWRAKVDRGELSAAPELLPCSCAWHIQEHWGHWHVELGDPPDLRKAERTPRAWAASRQLKNFLMQVPSWYEENFRNPASGYVFSAKSHLSCVSCKNQIRNSDRWELLKTYMLFCFLKGFWQVVWSCAAYYLSLPGLWDAIQNKLFKGLCFSRVKAELPFCISSGSSSSR